MALAVGDGALSPRRPLRILQHEGSIADVLENCTNKHKSVRLHFRADLLDLLDYWTGPCNDDVAHELRLVK